MKIGVVIVTHYQIGEEFLHALRLIVPNAPEFISVSIDPKQSVDEMRQLLDTAQYAPTRGRYKVYVIDEVHMLSTSAFNAMLKTLEEPPEHLKFILATTDPQKIPVTVLSRCLQFNLKQMPRAAIAALSPATPPPITSTSARSKRVGFGAGFASSGSVPVPVARLITFSAIGHANRGRTNVL